MIKLLALFTRPADVAAFEQHYNEEHLPLIRQVPGLAKLVVNTVWGAPRGEPAYYKIAEMWFADRAAFDTAMASDENRAAGKNLRSFVQEPVTMVFVESDEEPL
jgi:uncharacterized protein (TIGR02118 family)